MWVQVARTNFFEVMFRKACVRSSENLAAPLSWDDSHLHPNLLLSDAARDLCTYGTHPIQENMSYIMHIIHTYIRLPTRKRELDLTNQEYIYPP